MRWAGWAQILPASAAESVAMPVAPPRTSRPSAAYLDLDEIAGATGTVVVIDVLRAFTTAASALACGPASYELVATIEEAADRRAASPDTVRLLGEVDGTQPPDFDFSNSPRQFPAGTDLSGLDIVHRSSAGTQGATRATAAAQVLVASFAVAGATAAWLRDAGVDHVDYCITGASLGRDGEEDLACAEYIAALLAAPDADVDPAPYVARIATSTAGRMFLADTDPHLDADDLRHAEVVDRFPTALVTQRVDGRLMVQAVAVAPTESGRSNARSAR